LDGLPAIIPEAGSPIKIKILGIVISGNLSVEAHIDEILTNS